jgi:N-acetylmuramate 1-kinase
MKRHDLPEKNADARLDMAIDWLQTGIRGADAKSWTSIAQASVDASFRRYFRVTDDHGATAIVMDAPPPREDVRPFINMLQMLARGAINVPQLHASDIERGFLLLGDLGETTYLTALTATVDTNSAAQCDALFSDAIESLVRLQQISPTSASMPIAAYDAALLRREIDLFPDWYLGQHVQIELGNDEKNALERCYALLIGNALAQPTVLVHRDYMPRNLMALPERNPGVLDFQDAVVGPISYDIACLMRDAFISWEEPQIIDWTIRYWQQARAAGLPVREDFSEFYREFEWMGLQRHLKVMGIFARINYRDGKAKYLADTPRFIRYVRHVGQRYAAFSPLVKLFDRIEGSRAEVGYTF